MVPMYSWSVPLGLAPALFSIFVGDVGSGTEHIPSKFANDTKLRGADDTLEGRDAIHKAINRLEGWAHLTLMNSTRPSGKSYT